MFPDFARGALQERDLHRFAEKYLPSSLEKLYFPVRVDLGRGEEVIQYPMFPVREYLALLDSFGEQILDECCGISEGRQNSYGWVAME